MKKGKYFISLILLFVLLTGCGDKTDQKEKITEVKEIEKNVIDTKKDEEIIEDSKIEKQEILDIEKEIEDINYFTGLEKKEEDFAFMTIIENTKAARPQKGLSLADIVFEIPVERPITRYLAIFNSEQPTSIGPIRSTRPYIQDIAYSFDLAYAHCGGSQTALDTIKKGGYKSLNEMGNGKFYYRDNSRKAPHNLYTSFKLVKQMIDNKQYNNQPKEWINFNFNIDKDLFEVVNEIKIKPTSYVDYSHKYNSEENYYIRNIDGKLELDELNKEEYKFNNIGLIYTKVSNLNDAEKHVDVDLIGEGTFTLYRNGVKIKGTWNRDNKDKLFRFVDEKNIDIDFCPGKTWFYILDKNSIVEEM